MAGSVSFGGLSTLVHGWLAFFRGDLTLVGGERTLVRQRWFVVRERWLVDLDPARMSRFSPESPARVKSTLVRRGCWSMLVCGRLRNVRALGPYGLLQAVPHFQLPHFQSNTCALSTSVNQVQVVVSPLLFMLVHGWLTFVRGNLTSAVQVTPPLLTNHGFLWY